MNSGSPRLLHYTQAVSSGSGRYVAELSCALAAQGMAVTLVCPRDYEYGDQLTAAGVRVVRGPNSMAVVRGRPARLWRALVQATAGCRIAMGHSAPGQVVQVNFVGLPLLGAMVVGALRLGGRLVVLTVHDVTPHRPLLGVKLRWLELATDAALYLAASHLVVHHRGAADQLRRMFKIRSGRISVIPHAVALNLGHNDAQVAADRGPALRLALLGSIRQNKGIDLAIAAVQRLRQGGALVELTIAGHVADSEAAYWRSCQAAIAAAPDGLWVIDRYLDVKEMDRMQDEADAVLLPYRDFASQSGVALAALAAGRPIIATSAGGIGELLAASECGVRISEPSTEAVTRAVEDAIALGRAELMRRGMAGAQYVQQQLSWTAASRRHAELYRRLTSS